MVGYTRYSVGEIVQIARALIQAFGNYHRLFWNCQVYAEILVEIISTEGKQLPRYHHATLLLSTRWTSVDATQLFLCALVVPISTATTMKLRHEERKRKAMTDLNQLITEIEELRQNPRIRRLRFFLILTLVSEVDVEALSARIINEVYHVVAVDADRDLGITVVGNDVDGAERSLWKRFKELVVGLVG